MAKKNKNKGNEVKVNTNEQQKPAKNAQANQATVATKQAAEKKPDVQEAPQVVQQPQTNAVPVAEPIEITDEELKELVDLMDEEQKELDSLAKENKIEYGECPYPTKSNPIEEIMEKYSTTDIKRAYELISIGKTTKEEIDKFSGIDTTKMLELLSYGPDHIKSALDVIKLSNSLDGIKSVFQDILSDMQAELEAMRKRNGGV